MNEKKFLTAIICITFLFMLTSSSIATNDMLNTKVNSQTNNPPNPPLIDGPTSGRINKDYVYTFTLTDPDEDDYLTVLEVDFENDVQTAVKRTCERPWENGTIITIEHNWETKGEYNIKARVMDSIGEWSNWSEPLIVSMPKQRTTNPFWDIVKSLNHLFHICRSSYFE
jgi:hypothetical protein